MKKRLLAIAMTLAMTLSLLPMSALAAEGTEGTMTQAALEAEIAEVPAGGTVTLTGNVDVTKPIIITKELTLDLNGKTILNSGDIWNEAEYDWSLISVRAGGDLTITGKGMLQAKENDCYAVDVMDGGICTIENGTFVGNIHAVYVLEGMLVVNGGAFSVQQKYTDSSKADEFVLNCYDDHYRNGSASILVTGGTFENFNPSNCQAEGAGTSFMSADCKSDATSTDEGVTTYTVTKNQTITVDKPTSVSDGTVSATVGGESIPTDGEGDVVASGQTVTVDATVDAAEGNTVTTANVTVGGGALTAVKEAANVSNLAIETNVGTLTISDAALGTIIASATVGSSVSDVTLSIKVSDSDEHSVTYDFTATDARGEEVFDQTASEDATITVTVDAPESAAVGETVYIYYIDGDTRTLEDTRTVAEGKTVTWKVTHFSSREITKTMDEVTYTNSEGNKVTGTLAEAVENAKENTTITLNRDVTATDNAIAIENKITLDLNGHNIVKETGTSAIFSVKGGILRVTGSGTIESKMGDAFSVTGNTTPNTNKTEAVLVIEKGVRVKALWNCVWIAGNGAQADIYGSLTSTGVYAVIQGNGTKNSTTDYSGTIVNIYEGASVIHAGSDKNRAYTAIYQPQNGVLNIYGGTISAAQEGSTAIEIRAGELNISGDAVITGGNGTPESNPNGSGATTNNAAVAIAQHTTEQPIQVNITGGTISGGAAVYESNPENNAGTAAVSVTIENAELTGALNSSGFGTVTVDNTAITGNVGKTGTGSMGITGSTITGDVTKGENNSGYLGFVNSKITGKAPDDTTGSNVTYVNTKVGDDVKDTEDAGVAMIGGTPYETLADAIDAAADGQTIVLLAPITNVNYGTADKTNGNTMLYVDKSVTIAGNGQSIALTIPDAFNNDDQAIGVAEGKTLTLDGVTLTVTGGGEGRRGDGFDVWDSATLKITNGSNVTLTGLRSAFTMQGGNSAALVVEDSKVTANSIHGNVTNGGDVDLNNATVDINGCDSYGISANTITTTGNTTITADDVAYSAIYGYTEITFNEGAQVTVTNCTPKFYFSAGNYGDAKAPIQMKVKHKNGDLSTSYTEVPLTDKATLTVAEGATVTVSGSAVGIYLPSNVTYTNNGTVNATVEAAAAPSGSYTVTVKDGNTVLVSANVTSGSSYTLPDAPTKSGYTFTGWSDGSETYNAGGSVPISADTTFTAQWSYNGGGSSGGSTRYTVTAPTDVANGSVKVSPTRASRGQTVTITVTPDEGYELASLAVYDADGDAVSLTDAGNGKYTFTMPRSKVTVEAAFSEIMEEPETLPFADVPTGAYYYDAVAWAVENGVTGGTSATTFSPDNACTRAQMMTFLWRAAGSPEPESNVNPFADVSSSAYYYKAVLWAVENGITSGTSATTFSPDATVTRGQTVTFLWRNAGSPAASGGSFADVASDAYYAPAVAWAAREGITGGTSATTFSPDNACTRAQIVTFLWRDLI